MMGNISKVGILIFSSAFCSILGRELLNDTEDKDVDRGYKKTLSSLGILSDRTIHKISALLIFISAIALSVIIPTGITGIFLILSVMVLILSALIIYKDEGTRGKMVFDIGIFLVLITLAL